MSAGPSAVLTLVSGSLEMMEMEPPLWTIYMSFQNRFEAKLREKDLNESVKMKE